MCDTFRSRSRLPMLRCKVEVWHSILTSIVPINCQIIMTLIPNGPGPRQVDALLSHHPLSNLLCWNDVVVLFADGDDFSSETIEKNRNLFYQQQTASQISDQMNQATAVLTSMLNLHLNVGQSFTLNTPQVIMSLQTLAFDALTSDQPINSNGITLPTSALLNLNDQTSQTTFSVRVSFIIMIVTSHFHPVWLEDTHDTTGIARRFSSIVINDDEYISKCLDDFVGCNWQRTTGDLVEQYQSKDWDPHSSWSIDPATSDELWKCHISQQHCASTHLQSSLCQHHQSATHLCACRDETDQCQSLLSLHLSIRSITTTQYIDSNYRWVHSLLSTE